MEVRINGTSDVLEVEIHGSLAFPFTSTAYGPLIDDLDKALSKRQPVALDLSEAEIPDAKSFQHLIDLHSRFGDAQTPLGLCSVPASLQARLMAVGLPESAFHSSVEEFTFAAAS